MGKVGKLKKRNARLPAVGSITRLKPVFVAFVVISAILILAPGPPAEASPFIPAHGKGHLALLARFYASAHDFPTSYFDSSARPITPLSLTQFRLEGTRGLGGGWGLDFKLRGGEADRPVGGVTSEVSGLGDQQIRFMRGLTRTKVFADAIGLTVIVPTAAKGNGVSLGTGQFAIGPELQFEARRRDVVHRSFAEFTTGMLYYSGGEGQRWHASGIVGTQLSKTADFIVELGYRKSLSGVNVGRTLLRGDVELRFRSHGVWGPFVRYETDLGGRHIRQGSSILLGVSRPY